MTTNSPDIPIVVLISGSGSNLQALIDTQNDTRTQIAAVISNRQGVRGLERAQRAGIPTSVLDHTEYGSREAFDQALITEIDSYQPKLVILAGFMRILTPEMTHHYRGRMMNIHPSLLPKYKGLHTHKRALEAGDNTHGATVHFVSSELDGGPSIIQAQVPVKTTDNEESLQKRVLLQEHIIYPVAVGWFAAGRLTLDGDMAILDNRPLPPDGFQYISQHTSIPTSL